MKSQLRKNISYLIQPKVILCVTTIFLMLYVGYIEGNDNRRYGCYDCGYETRQTLFLFIASASLFSRKLWSVIVSLPLSLKVFYSIGSWAFFNNLDELKGTWRILISSTKATYEYHPRMFVEVAIGLIISLFALSFIRQLINTRYWEPK